MYWKPEYIALIIISTLVDYFAGMLMEKQEHKRKRKALLITSLLVNLGLLFVFKYFNFFYGELSQIYSAVSGNTESVVGLNLLLPMGISFYTFQTLSYTIDVYRGRRKAERHLGYFALYVTFFPQLVAGPIERSDRLLPQLRAKHKFNYKNMMSAILRICWGFFKKIVIADRVAILVNTVYGDLPAYSGVYYIIATLGFAVQIYCDFSAYSDIAIGSAKIMGIDLMENFRIPYLSKSISEFWSRWHISLSTWFKDYLYVPLGGNRVDKRWKVYRNVLIVFLVSGFWHGAEWTFLIWGALHGVYQIVERFIKSRTQIREKRFEVPSIVKTIFTFLLVLFAWIFFRADNISDAAYIISHTSLDRSLTLFDGQSLYSMGLDLYEFWLLIACCVWLFISDLFRYKRDKQQLIKGDFKQGLAAVFLIIVILVFGFYGDFKSTEFIYFQF